MGDATPPLEDHAAPRAAAPHRLASELASSDRVRSFQELKRTRTDDPRYAQFCAAVDGIDNVELPRAGKYGLTFEEYEEVLEYAFERYPGFELWYHEQMKGRIVLKRDDVRLRGHVHGTESIKELLERFVAQKISARRAEHAYTYIADRYLKASAIDCANTMKACFAELTKEKEKRGRLSHDDNYELASDHRLVKEAVEKMRIFQAYALQSSLVADQIPERVAVSERTMNGHAQSPSCLSRDQKANLLAWKALVTKCLEL